MPHPRPSWPPLRLSKAIPNRGTQAHLFRCPTHRSKQRAPPRSTRAAASAPSCPVVTAAGPFKALFRALLRPASGQLGVVSSRRRLSALGIPPLRLSTPTRWPRWLKHMSGCACSDPPRRQRPPRALLDQAGTVPLPALAASPHRLEPIPHARCFRTAGDALARTADMQTCRRSGRTNEEDELSRLWDRHPTHTASCAQISLVSPPFADRRVASLLDSPRDEIKALAQLMPRS